MVNKCGVVNCRGNYNRVEKCRLFKFPTDSIERQAWIRAVPPRVNFEINPDTYHICEKHWKEGYASKGKGKKKRPVFPPTEFDVKQSCLPTNQPAPRTTNAEDRQLALWKEKDNVAGFSSFHPEEALKKKYHHLSLRGHKIGCFVY